MNWPLLAHTVTAADYSWPTNASFSEILEIARQFTLLGVEHIITGYDHVLFLLCIVLLVRSWKTILLLLSTFTVAHSATLILAGLQVVTISPRFVEPVIAISIVYVALRNYMTIKSKRKERVSAGKVAAIAGFGLVHGLGFAGILVEAQIPRGFLVPSLLFFNIGVELGQIILMVIFLPMLFLADRLPYKRKALMTTTVIIAALAAFWFIQRLVS